MIPFDHFKVEVAFAHENLVGPYSGNGRRYTKFSKHSSRYSNKEYPKSSQNVNLGMLRWGLAVNLVRDKILIVNDCLRYNYT